MSAPDASDSSPASAEAQPVSVHIRFTPSQGRRLRRPEPVPGGDGTSLWVERPVLMERADGTYHLIGTTAHPDALARWVLSHGADAEVTGPDSLRRRVAAKARRIARRYSSEDADE